MSLKSPATALLRLAALAALALTAQSARASIFLSENLTGTLANTATLGGVPLGSPTGFSLHAVFNGDPSANATPSTQGQGFYQVTALSLTIAGHGSYNATLDGSLGTLLADPSNGTFPGFYVPGLYDGSHQLYPAFNTATPGLNPHALSPTVFSGFLGFLNPKVSLNLAGVPGGLSGPGGAATVLSISSASITAVPEPTTYAVVAGVGLLAFAAWRRRSV